jgi:ankyrin repeat protein
MGWILLHLTPCSSDLDLVQFLLKHRADMSAEARMGQLHCMGPRHLAMWILRSSSSSHGGADVTSKDEDGQAPLHWASCHGHPV